jgi:HTH-type transcriptional repressor of NAD biosynthesis genes
MNGLVLMTALPPTKGHKFLIDFALEYMKIYDSHNEHTLHVLINGRPHEPISALDRFYSFCSEYKNEINDGKIEISYSDDFIVQSPEDHPNFWNIWNAEIKKYVFDPIHFVFGSENYVYTLAEHIGAIPILCNDQRDVIKVSATQVRADPLKGFHNLLNSFQPYVRKTTTIFGPESIGKTTLAKSLAESINGHLVPEYARAYLENPNVGPEVTEDKMEVIVNGQVALQKAAQKLLDKPFIVQDTDILSTYGYYLLWKKSVPEFCKDIVEANLADYYIIPNEEIPFTPDILRYGVDKRESNNAFWINILESFNVPYYLIKSFSKEAQLKEATLAAKNFFYSKNNWRFER